MTRIPIARAGLILLAFLAGCATQPQMWRATAIAESSSDTIRLIGPDKQVLGYVERDTARKLIEIKDRIENAMGVSHALLLIATGDEPNAFAGPSTQGPIVGINLAMIKLQGSDWDAYAAIIGHEYAHLALNHSGIRKQREQARQGASSLLGVILSAAGVPMGGTLAGVATSAVSTIYTRDEEREADRVGLAYSRRAGYDPHGAIRAWERMMSVSSISIPFLSTHPTSEERLNTMKELATH